MAQSHQQLARLLTYSGALPFIACVLATIVDLNLIDASWVGVAYGAVILSFISGMHWGIYLFHAASCSRNLFITSNIATLFGWVSLLVYPHGASFLIQVSCFAGLLWLDRGLAQRGVLPPWFFRLRLHATFIVVSSLIGLYVFSELIVNY